ncbi:MAG: hypothetical protein M4579_001400 [Chaenotheca gracillima]|nr:MAG: hypothetical protein M4579_001400 [Chaenotheca gracillima]
MVKLEPVEDEHFAQQQTGAEEDEDDFTDTDSEVSSVSDSDERGDSLEESIADRLLALKDILPPKQRAIISNTAGTGFSWLKAGLGLGGKTLWVVSTSALLLGVPWAISFQEELTINEMEKEQKMQQSANELLAPGAQGQQQQGAQASL